MSSYLKIEWTPLEFPVDVKAGKSTSIINHLVKPLPKDKPILFFFGTERRSNPKDEKSALTKEAIRSAEFADEFFDENLQIQLALRFFNCYDIDLTKIPKSKSRTLCHDNSPLLVIYDKGKIVKVLRYQDKGRIYPNLISALKKRDIDIAKLNRKVVKPLQDLLLLNQKLYLLGNNFEELKGKYKKSPSKSLKKKLIKYNNKYKAMDSDKIEVQTQITAIIKQYDKKSKTSVPY